MCQLSHGPIFPTNTLFQAANTIHVFVEPVSKVQVSAKEIRSRIFGGGNHKPEVPSTPEVAQTPKIRTEMVLTSPASSTTTTDVEFLESTHLTSASAGGDSFKTSLEDSTADDRFELFVLLLFISKSFRFNNRNQIGRAAVLAQWLSTCLVVKTLRVQLLLDARLFSIHFVTLSLPLSSVFLSSYLKDVQH